MFFHDFATIIESVSAFPGRILLSGDFNFHLDDASDRDANTFLDVLESRDLQQYVTGATHKKGHTLDLLISRKSDELISQVAIQQGLPSDHFVLSCLVNMRRPAATKRLVTNAKIAGHRHRQTLG